MREGGQRKLIVPPELVSENFGAVDAVLTCCFVSCVSTLPVCQSQLAFWHQNQGD